MDKTFYITHPQLGIYFSDATTTNNPKHCLMSEDLAIAMAAEMQFYPETRGAEVAEFDGDMIELAGYKPFVLG